VGDVIIIDCWPGILAIKALLRATAKPRLRNPQLFFPIPVMQNVAKGALRVAKNYTKGYSDTQAKLREATSNDAWGPSGTQMNELAQMTFNQYGIVHSLGGRGSPRSYPTLMLSFPGVTSLRLWKCWTNGSMIRVRIGVMCSRCV
jgi:hypothetical protein